MSTNESENITPFREWLEDRFHTLSREYRMQLATVVRTCQQHAVGSIWTIEASTIGISCLPDAPVVGRYPGEVSEEDKAWYRECLKPDFAGMKGEAIREIRKLENIQPFVAAS